MRPEASAYLDKSRECLERAEWILQRYPEVAGREAYLAGLHAAQALIVEKTGAVAKSHKGVHSELHRLTKDEPSFDVQRRAFLGRTYNLKAISDYLSGPGSRVSPELATQSITEAREFIAAIIALLPAA